MKERIYLDFNATTPLAPEVAAAMQPYLREGYGNPSSLHWAGLPARDAVETARSQVAALLCCDATEIIFTSGGTEANNHAIKGLYFAQCAGGKPVHIITSQIEHPAAILARELGHARTGSATGVHRIERPTFDTA